MRGAGTYLLNANNLMQIAFDAHPESQESNTNQRIGCGFVPEPKREGQAPAYEIIITHSPVPEQAHLTIAGFKCNHRNRAQSKAPV